MDATEVRVGAWRQARRRVRDRVRRATVDRVVAERVRLPAPIGQRVVGDVLAVARVRTGGHGVAYRERLVVVDERERLALAYPRGVTEDAARGVARRVG